MPYFFQFYERQWLDKNDVDREGQRGAVRRIKGGKIAQDKLQRSWCEVQNLGKRVPREQRVHQQRPGERKRMK